MYLFIAYFRREQGQEGGTRKRQKKGTNIWPMPPTPQSMQNSSTDQHLHVRVFMCVCACVCQGHDDNCAKNILPKNTERKRDKQSGKPKDNKCCRQILSTSRLLSLLRSIHIVLVVVVVVIILFVAGSLYNFVSLSLSALV